MRGRTRQTALINVLVASGIAAVAVAAWVLVHLDGWTYYHTPLRVRGYLPQHALLKPSGTIAHPLGVVGVLMLFVPVVYTLRKRWGALARTGSISTWLEVHIFCGIVGPVLVTFHTSFKFNGMISVAYWSMAAVTLSGFVGRYLYVRIPKNIRGTELSHEEIRMRAVELAARLADRGVSGTALDDLATGDAVSRWGRRRLARLLTTQGVDRATVRAAVGLARERSVLLKRLAYLQRTKRLFETWHVFHQPLVYLMFGIVVVHVGVALYFGYSWW